MSDLMRSFLIAASGALLPAIAGTILANYRCVLSEEGCETDYACTTDTGHCNGQSLKKKGTGLVWGVCVTRTGFTCNQVLNQACFEELYYENSACDGDPCGQSSTTTPNGCTTS